jgi:hypothetical protein
MHGSRSKISSKKSRPYIYDVKFLALLGAPYIYDFSKLRVKQQTPGKNPKENIRHLKQGESLRSAKILRDVYWLF